MLATVHSLPNQGLSKGTIFVSYVIVGFSGLWEVLKEKTKSWSRNFFYILLGSLLLPLYIAFVGIFYPIWKIYFHKKTNKARLELKSITDEIEALLLLAKSQDQGKELAETNFFSKEIYDLALNTIHVWDEYGDTMFPKSLVELKKEPPVLLKFFFNDTIPFLEENKRLMLLSKDYLNTLDKLRPESNYFHVLSHEEVEAERSGVYDYIA